MPFILFILFALTLAVMYLGIRRQWVAPGIIAGVGIVISMIIMVLFSLAQANQPLQAVVVGVLLGGLFGGVTVVVAWYFHSNEMRARYAREQVPPEDESINNG
jgi:RsiW-degrading membrane proteinase PrsW (M82 family)